MGSDVAGEIETLAPAQATALLRRQEALQAEAARVLADLGLLAMLSSAGTVSQVGSSVTGLMAWRDIDIEVLCDDWTADLAFRTVRPLAAHPRVSTLTYRSEAGRFKPPGLSEGYYWGVRYLTEADDEWKIDIWFWPRSASAGDTAHATELRQRLTPETRLAILWIKDVLHGQPLYRSFDLYDAVLNHGIRTPAEFERYQAAKERRSSLEPIGVVLAGGKSRRLGRDKALLRLPDGRTLLEHTVTVLREAGLAEIAVSVSTPERATELRAAIPALADPRFVIDDTPGAGPLAALCSALRAFPGRPVLLAACDLPRLEAAAPRLLLREWESMNGEDGGEDDVADMLVPVAQGHRQPLLALYGPACLPVATRLLARGRRAMRELLDAPELRLRTLDDKHLARFGITLETFANLNTPGELAALMDADG